MASQLCAAMRRTSWMLLEHDSGNNSSKGPDVMILRRAPCSSSELSTASNPLHLTTRLFPRVLDVARNRTFWRSCSVTSPRRSSRNESCFSERDAARALHRPQCAIRRHELQPAAPPESVAAAHNAGAMHASVLCVARLEGGRFRRNVEDGTEEGG